jgi:hypothetical protein
MHRGLPWSCSGLGALTGASLGGSLRSCFTGSITVGKSETLRYMQFMWCKE